MSKQKFRFVNYVWDIFADLKIDPTTYTYIKTPNKLKCNIISSELKSVVQVNRQHAINHESVLKEYKEDNFVIPESIFINTHYFYITPRLNLVESKSLISKIVPLVLEMWQKGITPIDFDLNHYSIDGNSIIFWPIHLCIFKNSLVIPNYTRKRIGVNSTLSLHSGVDERRLFLQHEAKCFFYDALVCCLEGVCRILNDVSSKKLSPCPTQECISKNHNNCMFVQDVFRQTLNNLNFEIDVSVLNEYLTY